MVDVARKPFCSGVLSPTNAHSACRRSATSALSFLADRATCGAAVEVLAVPFAPFWPVLACMPPSSCQQAKKKT